MPYIKILAIDQGGSSAKVSLISEEGKILDRLETIRTVKGNLFPNLKKQIYAQRPSIEFDYIGVSIAGFVSGAGFLHLSGNLNMKNVDIKKEIEAQFKKPCFALNDANAAALGEMWLGNGKDFNSFLFYIIGTGVGGGVILNRKIWTGETGIAGEFGHGGYFQDVRDCTCGLKNCVEAVSSAKAIDRNLKNMKNPRNLRDITNDMLKNDAEIRKVFEDSLTPLSHHISVLLYALNPSAVILGGGASNIGDEIPIIIHDLLKKCTLPLALDCITIRNASLRNDAGMIGAAAWVLESIKS